MPTAAVALSAGEEHTDTTVFAGDQQMHSLKSRDALRKKLRCEFLSMLALF